MTTEDKCNMCRGIGKIGEPPVHCDFCNGTGKVTECGLPAEDSTENMPDHSELGTRILDFLREIHESDTTPESGDVEHIYSLISEYSDGYYSQAELDRRVVDHYSEGYLSEDEVIGLLGKLTDAMGRNVDDFDSDDGFLSCCERLVDSAVEYIAEAEERQRFLYIGACEDSKIPTDGDSYSTIYNDAIDDVIYAILNAGGNSDE